MKAIAMFRRMFVSVIGMVAFSASIALSSSIVFSQDSTFLACGQYSDRGQRIACLEDALEAATAASEDTTAASEDATAASEEKPAPIVPPTMSNSAVVAQPPESVPAPAQTPATADEPAPLATVPATESDPSLLERLRNFGKRDTADAGATVSTGEDGREQLHDTIAKLDQRNNLWVVTLSSGQVWMQQIPRRLNLREGDKISIYQAGIGNGYRLATSRLSGFIRVERMR